VQVKFGRRVRRHGMRREKRLRRKEKLTTHALKV
jgi:hypothetical protein